MRVVEDRLARPGSPGEMLIATTLELRAHGHARAAAELASRAVAWYANRPAGETDTEAARYGLGRAFYVAERWDGALDCFRTLVRDAPDNIDYLGYLGAVQARRGDRGEASRVSAALGRPDRPNLAGRQAYWRARIASLLGDQPAAVDLLREALAQGVPVPDDLHREMDFEALRGFAPFDDLLEPGQSTKPPVAIAMKAGTDAERRTKAQLERVLHDYDLSKYVFTRQVTIETGAINHAFPVLTLNVRFADSEDELLASFAHEQLHWHLRDRAAGMQDALAELRRFYPKVPVGGTEGAETEYSTYGHLVDCYLEILAARQFIGPDRTLAVVRNKGHYTWIYATILADEPRFATLVERHHLGVK